MKQFDYFAIYSLVVLPFTLTISYFLEADKAASLRWDITIWSITILASNFIGEWLAKRDNKRDIDELWSQESIDRVVDLVFKGRKNNE